MSRRRKPGSGGRPGSRPGGGRSSDTRRQTLSWPLAVWLTPPAALLVFVLMIILTVAQPDGDSSVITAGAAAGSIFAVGGLILLLRGGRRGRGVGVALIAGGLLAGLLGVWAVIA